MTAGNLYGALGAFLTQVEYAEARVKEGELTYYWPRELFWALSGVGSVLQQQGFLTEAEEALQRAYDVSSRHNLDFPDSPNCTATFHWPPCPWAKCGWPQRSCRCP